MRIILLFFIIVAMSSCLISLEPKYPACYGIEFNPTREALGIPLLKDDWIPVNTSDSITTWRPPINKKGMSYHSFKKIKYLNGTLAWEVDNYKSNKKFVTVDVTAYESLSIRYYYISSKYDQFRSKDESIKDFVGFEYIYAHNEKHGYHIQSDRITKFQADSLLTLWGLADEIVPLPTKK